MANDQITFSFEVVAVLVAALNEKGGTVGSAEFEAMVKFDGDKTACGYQHLFRKVKARAKEIAAQSAAENTNPAKEKKKSDKCTASADKGSNGLKRGATNDHLEKAKQSRKKIKTEDIDGTEEDTGELL